MRTEVIHYAAAFLFVGAMGIASNSFPASGSLLHGVGEMTLGGWNFSAQRTVHWNSGDLAVGYVVDPPLGYWLWGVNGASIAMVDSSFAELALAPEDSTLYYPDWPMLQEETYVIRTGDGFYAKFRILNSALSTIEYVYQTNGSRKLREAVPVEPTTWGRIKNLYLHP